MNYKKFLSLKEYNTFGIDVKSVYSFFCFNENELISFLKSDKGREEPYYILGGGSNVLFSEDYKGTIVLIKSKGISVVQENSNFVFIKAAAGEIWDDFVEYCVINNYGGVENLSFIPGTVGASPVQNIGAYGVEVKDIIDEIEVLNRKTLKKEVFLNKNCKFGYRDSIFKSELRNKYIILNVTFKLSKKHKLNLDYGNLNDELKLINNPGISDVRQAVINIRARKLPNPDEFPNAGSFFKNPVVKTGYFKELKEKFPELVSYPAPDEKIKLAAGQLIDLCNWKGKRENGTGVHDKQALVIVNYNNASGKDILNFSEKIQNSVFEKFGVKIEREVTLIN
ncbi:MAG: UDP-N-acetylmuramate dehydrogenase [Bacteroidales bacterium]|nr:UDP-N-acetylmuramate dehydrogenase [Bacteroidales bacterium]